MDLFLKLGNELRDLFKNLFHPEKKTVIESKIADIVRAANLIGGKIAEEAISLEDEVNRYLKNPKDKKLIESLKNQAMKLEQQTREI